MIGPVLQTFEPGSPSSVNLYVAGARRHLGSFEAAVAAERSARAIVRSGDEAATIAIAVATIVIVVVVAVGECASDEEASQEIKTTPAAVVAERPGRISRPALPVRHPLGAVQDCPDGGIDTSENSLRIRGTSGDGAFVPP